MDNQNIKPAYYQGRNGDLIDHFKDIFGEDETENFMVMNAIKYLTRYKYKNGIEDLEKARTYVNRLIEVNEN